MKISSVGRQVIGSIWIGTLAFAICGMPVAAAETEGTMTDVEVETDTEEETETVAQAQTGCKGMPKDLESAGKGKSLFRQGEGEEGEKEEDENEEEEKGEEEGEDGSQTGAVCKTGKLVFEPDDDMVEPVGKLIEEAKSNVIPIGGDLVVSGSLSSGETEMLRLEQTLEAMNEEVDAEAEAEQAGKAVEMAFVEVDEAVKALLDLTASDSVDEEGYKTLMEAYDKAVNDYKSVLRARGATEASLDTVRAATARVRREAVREYVRHADTVTQMADAGMTVEGGTATGTLAGDATAETASLETAATEKTFLEGISFEIGSRKTLLGDSAGMRRVADEETSQMAASTETTSLTGEDVDDEDTGDDGGTGPAEEEAPSSDVAQEKDKSVLSWLWVPAVVLCVAGVGVGAVVMIKKKGRKKTGMEAEEESVQAG